MSHQQQRLGLVFSIVVRVVVVIVVVVVVVAAGRRWLNFRLIPVIFVFCWCMCAGESGMVSVYGVRAGC